MMKRSSSCRRMMAKPARSTAATRPIAKPLRTSECVIPRFGEGAPAAFAYRTMSEAAGPLEIEVLDAFRVVEDVLLARLDFIAHEVGKDLLGFYRIFDRDLLQPPIPDFHRRLSELILIHFAQTLVLLDRELFGIGIPQNRAVVSFAERPPLLFALADTVQRRLRDVDEATLYERPHLPVEKGQQQRSYVRTIDVGIGHDDDLVIAQLLEAELIAEPSSERRDHGTNFFVREHFIQARLFDVDDLAAKRQDRLGDRVAAALRSSAGGIALDEKDLAFRRI